MSDEESNSSEGEAEEEEDLEWKPLGDFNEDEEERLDEIFGKIFSSIQFFFFINIFHFSQLTGCPPTHVMVKAAVPAKPNSMCTPPMPWAFQHSVPDSISHFKYDLPLKENDS